MEMVVSEGPAAEAILRVAENEDVDLIVMATHGRSGLRRWVYGSVTEKVLRSAGRAMFVIRPPRAALN
jgi:nucleotide-binding universal stress UspA family protein